MVVPAPAFVPVTLRTPRLAASRLAAAVSAALLLAFSPAPAQAHGDHGAPEPLRVAQSRAAAVDADGFTVDKPSRALSLASAEEVEKMAAQQYAELRRQAAAQRALAPPDHPQMQRLQRIADRLIPFAPRFNDRAPKWRWEISLIGSRQINAFCMPGGKIAFYTGLIDRLKLSDDEIAVVMGHEIAHALLEHGRERVGKGRIAQGVAMGASLLSNLLGYGNLGGAVADTGAQFLLLKYGRDDEKEADGVGLDLSARAGYDPRAALTLWRKMAQAAGGAGGPEWLSTHPSHDTRTREIEALLPKVMPLYERARRG